MTDIFLPVATQPPPAFIERRTDHPAPRLGINKTDKPISTNKFYANFFLGNRNQASWTHPYSVTWSKGGGTAQSWGLSISHTDADQLVYGDGDPARYYFNPVGIQSIILSASELGRTTSLSLDNPQAFSVFVNLQHQLGAPPAITFPLLQGMGFVTGIYNNARPVIESGVGFRCITRVSDFSASSTQKYRITLEDGKTWLLYATDPNGSAIELRQVSNSRVEASCPYAGFIQIAKVPKGSASTEAVYDTSAGVYPIGMTLIGHAGGTEGFYQFRWTKTGVDTYQRPLVMFALPHHVESFDAATSKHKTALQLQTTTKGIATAVLSNSWTLTENKMPTKMGFEPWSPILGSCASLTQGAIAKITEAAAEELCQDMNAQTNLDSMYFSGKALSKFAMLIYTVHTLAKTPKLAHEGLAKLKKAFAVFAQNKQKNPLVYETAWKGLVSVATYATGDPYVDFGNSYYNDHHFHYGYFIHAAAVIGHLDPAWLGENKDWVNLLVRDAANPNERDTHFPVSRSFDWYNGHSWAKGLFESADGKDQESSSEDAFFAYAVKMWGKTVEDLGMELRGNLMLSILARTLRHYYLMEESNRNQPPRFIGNKVAGILFDNKADHTTYFGNNIEYIQGIHMLPINPSSALTRNMTFVAEEWIKFFSGDRADQVAGGWRGILYANLAIIDPVAAWEFFSQPNFKPEWLDGGASRAWYLAYAAALGGIS